MRFIDRLLGRDKNGSSEDEAGRESRKSWSPEEAASAIEEGPAALRAILESLEPTEYFAPGDLGELVGGHSSPSEVFGPDGRTASSGIFDTGRTAARLVEFWKTGRMFENVNETITIAKRHAEVSEESVTIRLDTDETDDRIGVGFHGGRDTSAYIFYLRGSSS